ncbi:head decoration protein [Novosphingobium sp. FSW06-99]|uniref:head decoration protein n=1 Tax=Novosphingobium sp. FSW06-99 TaxID=1739113 RepID=UPI00076C8247|nr:head decoration protein [Novosphingobium sp. FSW06-99]KUR80763.1 hypothetical protein AQZ49_01675 [Novosphingobium sp. FSW06-99]
MTGPTVTPFTETWHAWGFVIWEPSDGMVTRSQITLAAGYGTITAGTVLGALLTGTGSVVALGTNTGNGTFGAITVGSQAALGNYSVIFEAPTEYVVLGPNGQEVGHGVTGAAFNAGGLGFTITAGGTAFVAGDSFALTVVGTEQYAPYDPTQNNGLQNACAILGSGYKNTASAAQLAAAIVRGPCRVNVGELVWGANVTTTPQQNAAIAALSALGIQAS